MEKRNRNKCTSKEHLDLEAVSYCHQCKLFMCNKCEIIHSNLCPHHNKYNLDKDINEIFTGFCMEENHLNELNYFCKTHNQLCCAACLCKIKGKKNDGIHSNCDACFIEEIKDEKRKQLKENVECLENLSKNLENSIKELKGIFEEINNNKEELKIKIQQIFTQIRNTLNEREDKLLSEVDIFYRDIFCSDNIIKQSEKLPQKIKLSLEKGKSINNEWNNNEEKNLVFLIHDCINIEKNIKDINLINKNIKKCNENRNKKIKFEIKEKEKIISLLNSMGQINYNNFSFKKCPIDSDEYKKYILTGNNNNIVTKTEKTSWVGIICENELENFKIHKWKIKILNTEYRNIMVGVAPIDFNLNASSYDTYGWNFSCYSSKLFSGPPHNYNFKVTQLSKVKNEIILVMDMNQKTLKFIIDDEDKGESYSDIPLDKSITPIVYLYDRNDSVEIIDC